MSEAHPGEFLEAQPIGKTLWLTIVGRSMAPLLRSGDALRVLRCELSALAPGDIAIARRADGALIAHLVRATRPFSTTTFLCRTDDDAGVVLGKAVAMRRGTLKLPIPRGARALLWLLHLGGSAAYRNPRARAAAKGLLAALSRTRRVSKPR